MFASESEAVRSALGVWYAVIAVIAAGATNLFLEGYWSQDPSLLGEGTTGALAINLIPSLDYYEILSTLERLATAFFVPGGYPFDSVKSSA